MNPFPADPPAPPHHVLIEEKNHFIICRKAPPRRKPLNSRIIRPFPPFLLCSRTCGIDHNLLMKYASGVQVVRSRREGPVRVFAPAGRLLSMSVPVLSSSTRSHRSASISPSLSPLSHCHPASLSLSLIASIFVHLRNHQELPTWRKGS